MFTEEQFNVLTYSNIRNRGLVVIGGPVQAKPSSKEFEQKTALKANDVLISVLTKTCLGLWQEFSEINDKC